MLAASVISNEESFYRTSLQTTPYFSLATGMEGIVPSYDSGMSSDSSPEMVYPYLEITVQPTDKFRFRYRSESGSHGKLRGPAKNRSKTNFPTVKLHNYMSRSKIEVKVSLYTNEEDPRPHILQLVGKNCSGGTCTKALSEDNTVMFQYLEIESKKKDELLKILFDNKMDLLQEGEEYDEEEIKREAVNEGKSLNMNAARLCFEAFHNSIPICEKVFSTPIINLKAASSDLKITRLSLVAGRCSGGEDMILLCDKINKEDIKIRFYEKNENGDLVWEEYGDFNKADVHHQVAIPLKTPAFYDNTEKIVNIELYRPSDGQSGEARLFTYIPDEIDVIRFSKKRKYAPAESATAFQDITQASSSSSSSLFMGSPSGASTSRTDGDDLYLDEHTGPSTSSYDHIFNEHFPDGFQLPNGFDFDLLDGIELVDQSNYLPLLQAMQNKDIHAVTDNQTSIFEASDNSNPLIQMDSAIHPQSYVPFDMDKKVYAYETSKQTGIFGYLSQLGDFTRISGTTNVGAVKVVAVSPPKDNYARGTIGKVITTSSKNRKKIEDPCHQLNSCKKTDTNKNFDDFKRSITVLLKNQKKDVFMRYITNLMSAEDEDGNLLLHLAVLQERDNINLIAKMLDIAPQNVNKQNKLKETCLHLATMKDSWKVLLLLMARKGNPAIKNQAGNNCFHLAAKSNSVESMKLLLLQNLKFGKPIPAIDELNYDGLSALHLSIMNNAKECLLLLLKAGANVNIAEHKTGRTALHLAMEKHRTLVGPLLSHPLIDAYSKDFSGCTAFIGYLFNRDANCADGVNGDIYNELLVIAENSNKKERQAIISYVEKAMKEMWKPRQTAEDIDENESCSCESSGDTDSEDVHNAFTATHQQARIENVPFHNVNCTQENLKTFDEEKLCEILDANSRWKKLGEIIGFDESILSDLEILSQGSSPTRILLKKVKTKFGCDYKETLKNMLQMAELEEAVRILNI